MNGATHEQITVLIVEDEAIIRMDVADYISDGSVCALEAMNADEAIRILEGRDDIDVLFTDVNMPGSMDGLELAARVRQRWPRIGIIITSGMVRVGRSALPANASFFEKPYDLAQVNASLRRLAMGADVLPS